MGSLTDKYQQLRKETEEKQQIEQEMQKQEAYYGNIINLSLIHISFWL